MQYVCLFCLVHGNTILFLSATVRDPSILYNNFFVINKTIRLLSAYCERLDTCTFTSWDCDWNKCKKQSQVSIVGFFQYETRFQPQQRAYFVVFYETCLELMLKLVWNTNRTPPQCQVRAVSCGDTYNLWHRWQTMDVIHAWN